MKIITKILAVLLLLIFLVSTIAGSVLGENDSISLNARWYEKDYGESLSVMEGQEAKIFLTILSTQDFALRIDLYEKDTQKWVKTSFADDQITERKFKQAFPLETKGLGSIAGKDYLVRIEAVNSLTHDTKIVYLDLKITKKLNLKFPQKNNKKENEAPIIAFIPDQEVFEDSKLQFDVYSSDSDKDFISVEGEICSIRLLGSCIFKPLRSAGAYLQIKEKEPGFNHAVFSWTPDFSFLDHPVVAKNVEARFRTYDGKRYSEWRYVNIMVKDVNRAPVLEEINDHELNAGETVDFLISADDQDNDKLYLYLFNKPDSAIFVDNGDGTAIFTWTPLSKDVGDYELTFLVNDGPFQGQQFKKITIKVKDLIVADDPGDSTVYSNHAPLAADDHAEISGSSVEIDVLANDYDPDGDAISISALGSPKYGTVKIKDGRVLYMADGNFLAEEDFFDYQITDGKEISSAMVYVKNSFADNDENDDEAPKRCSLEGQYFLAKDGFFNFEGQTIHLENIYLGDVSNGKETEVALISVREGFSSNLDFDYFTLCDTKSVGKLKITVTGLYWDGTRTSEDSWIKFNVEYMGDEDLNHAPFAVDDHVELIDNSIEIGVLDNDYDPDGDALSISDLGDAKYGVVEIKNNKVLYIANENFIAGNDFFDYQITDGKEISSAMVYITRSFEDDSNHAPILDPIGNKIVKEGELLTFKVTASDEDGDELNYYASFLPEGAAFDPETQIFSWKPSYDQANKPQDSEFQELYDLGYIGENGQYITTFVVSDGKIFDAELVRITVLDGEPAEPAQEPLVPYTNIKFKSVSIAQEGDYAYLNANLLNNGDEDLEDLRVTATIYSLGVKGSGSVFALESGKNTSVNVYVPLPYGVNPGYYLVKITVKNSYYHDSTYRLLYLG